MKVARAVWTLAKSARIARDEEVVLEGIRLEIGSTVTGTIDSADDSDLYNFTVTAEDTYIMIASGFDTELYLMDQDKNLIVYNDDSLGLSARIIRSLEIGSYYLEVGGWSSATGTYQLSLNVE